MQEKRSLKRIKTVLRNYWPFWILFVGLGAVIGLLMAIYCEWGPFGQLSQNFSFKQRSFLEAFKFLLLGMVGGALTYFYNAHQRRREQEREQRDARREFLRSYYSELVSVYNESKRVRRALRAWSRLGDGKLLLKSSKYEEEFFRLEQAQLNLEHLWRRVSANYEMFNKDQEGDVAAELRVELNKAYAYLRDVLHQFEQSDHFHDESEMSIEHGSEIYQFIVLSDTLKAEGLVVHERAIDYYWPSGSAVQKSPFSVKGSIKRNLCFDQPMEEIERRILRTLKAARGEKATRREDVQDDTPRRPPGYERPRFR